jgi:hypothetical protein
MKKVVGLRCSSTSRKTEEKMLVQSLNSAVVIGNPKNGLPLVLEPK